MILNPTNSAVNDSQKISELRKLTKVTKHQENTWIPIAQFNSRTLSYTNAAINLQAITAYMTNNYYDYFASKLGEDWENLQNIGYFTTHSDLQDKIHNSYIANNIVSYSFSYGLQYLDWQIAYGSYIPGYIPRPSLDDIYAGNDNRGNLDEYLHKDNFIEVVYNG